MVAVVYGSTRDIHTLMRTIKSEMHNYNVIYHVVYENEVDISKEYQNV